MATNENCSGILQDSFQYSCEQGLPWTDNMKSMLSKNGLMECFINKAPDVHLKSSQRLQDVYHQTTFEGIKKEDSKLRTYALFKTTPVLKNTWMRYRALKKE